MRTEREQQPDPAHRPAAVPGPEASSDPENASGQATVHEQDTAPGPETADGAARALAPDPDGQRLAPMRSASRRVRSLALSGILTGFTVLCLYVESIVPTGRAGFYVLTSFILSALFLETGMKWVLGAYVASAALAFVVVPDKVGLLPFLLLFGIYPVLKNLVERIGKLWLEWVLKLVGFNVLLAVGYALFAPLLPAALSGAATLWAVLALEVGFIVYDLLFTQWIHFYFDRIAPHVRRNRR